MINDYFEIFFASYGDSVVLLKKDDFTIVDFNNYAMLLYDIPFEKKKEIIGNPFTVFKSSEFNLLKYEEFNIILKKIISVIKKNKSKKITVAKNPLEVKQLWSARKSLSPALRSIGEYKINEDIAVPISNLTKLLDKLEEISKKYNTKIVNFGHGGNGNIHVNLIS